MLMIVLHWHSSRPKSNGLSRR